MKRAEQIKKCNTCSIVLTLDNKVKDRNSCKECQRKKHRDYLKTYTKPSPFANVENISNVINTCNKCSVSLTDEDKIKGRNICKECRAIKRKEYVENKLSNKYSTFDGTLKCSSCSKVLTLENCTRNRPMCKDCTNAKSRDYKRMNREKVSESRKEYYQTNKGRIAEYYKKHYKNNKDTYMDNNRKWREANRKHIREQYNERLRSNPTLRLIKNCRTRIWTVLKNYNGKENKTVEYLDCDIDFFKKWLQYNFTDSMTFDNYGTYWHVDHVIPCSRFDLTDEDSIKHCFRWTNLQPLEGVENMMKQDNVNNVEVKSHYKKVKKFATENKIDIPKFNYRKYLVNDISDEITI